MEYFIITQFHHQIYPHSIRNQASRGSGRRISPPNQLGKVIWWQMPFHLPPRSPLSPSLPLSPPFSPFSPSPLSPSLILIECIVCTSLSTAPIPCLFVCVCHIHNFERIFVPCWHYRVTNIILSVIFISLRALFVCHCCWMTDTVGRALAWRDILVWCHLRSRWVACLDAHRTNKQNSCVLSWTYNGTRVDSLMREM